MVLDRMSVFAAPQAEGSAAQKRWTAAGRVVMAAVVLCNTAGLAANVASAVHFQRAAVAMNSASQRYAANSTDDAKKFRTESRGEMELGGVITSVQLFCEVAALLLIVAAFGSVGVLSARRVSARLRGVDSASAAMATGRMLRLQIAGTAGFVFVSFVVRSMFSAMYAFVYIFRDLDTDSNCPLVCGDCRNSYALIMQWMLYTPEFQLTIMLISSPVALLVALWGMTTKATLRLLSSSERGTLDAPASFSLRLLVRKE